MAPHSLAIRKQLGAYYTPVSLSRVLTDWAINCREDRVLEPSFGGCGFLEASRSTLLSLGATNPVTNLYGADIDEHAFDFLSKKIGKLIDLKKDHFIKGDFLRLSPKDFAVDEFDVIVGNPPYVSLHNMSQPQRDSCSKVVENFGYSKVSLGINVSLWAYFLIHSLTFLRDNGRVAWVLPSSILNTVYSKKLIEIYRRHFNSVRLVKLETRYFLESGADEVSVILAAEGFTKSERNSKSKYSFHSAKDNDSLRIYLENNIVKESDDDFNYKYSLIARAMKKKYQEVKSGKYTSILGDTCTVKIGLVTGDNSTFLVNSSTVREYGLSESDIRPVVAKFSHLKGIIHTEPRHEVLRRDDKRCLLVCPESLKKKGSPVRSYLSRVSSKNRRTNKTFPKRKNWYYPDDHRIPDAFLSYMMDRGPRMVINIAKYNCTNSIHRVYFREKTASWKKKAIALSLMSSFSQLSAEIEGRAYGSGVLKLEPSAAANLCYFSSPEILKALYNSSEKITSLIEAGEYDSATAIVDKIISEKMSSIYRELPDFTSTIKRLREDRYGGLRG